MSNELAKKIETVLISHFSINPREYAVNFEVIRLEKDREKFSRIKEQYERNLKTHPHREKAARRLYVSDDFILYIQSSFPWSEVAGLEPGSVLYYPNCTLAEIRRIERVACAEDYLLKLRADAIADDPRLVRIFLARRDKAPDTWSLSSHFEDDDFSAYLGRLPAESAARISGLSSGYAILKEPNGLCIDSPYGKVIVVSEALKNFLFFMNIFLFGENWDIPTQDRMNALVIGVKTMLLTEPLDFDLDPRGELPPGVSAHCWSIVRDQVQFVIGHEYAHALLDHFATAKSLTGIERVLYAKGPSPLPTYFSPRQKQEFEADAGSILHAEYSDAETAALLNAAAIFFLHLDVFYAVSDYINPPGSGVKTHPAPLDRLWTLRKQVLGTRLIESEVLYSDEEMKNWQDYAGKIKSAMLKEFLPFHVDQLEEYASVYLPSYRKEELHDRFDY